MVNKPCNSSNNKTKQMKKLLAILAFASMSAGAFAACGKTVTNEGTLKSYDAEKKTVVIVDAAGKSATVTLTPSTTGADKIADLVGKAVKVVSEHNKAQSVAVAEAKKS